MKQLKKTLLTLVALLAVTTGAWADETPLVTIESKDYSDFKSGNMTFDDKVTITFSDEVYNDGDGWGWYTLSSASLLTVAGTNGYTITSCKFYVEYGGTAKTGYTIAGESPSVYISEEYVYTDASKTVNIGSKGITKIEVYGTAPAAASGPEVAWNAAEKTGKFTMPGGNVTLEPEYYPQAALATQPTAINDVPATTDGAIVEAGTVASIGETTNAQGTVMYYVSPSALDDAALQALAADQWTADVPTAADLAQGPAYVYYYVRGNDSDTDEEIFSDGDILAANALTVTIAAEPTYAVTFADGVNPEPPAQPEWTASPAAGVKKGQTVTVTYTGTKKVIGVKAEKKAAAAAAEGHALSASAVGEIVGSDGKAYAVADKDNLPSGVTAVAMIAYVGTASDCAHGLAIALADESDTKNYEAAGTACSGKAAVTGGTWRLPSIKDWQYMFIGCGASDSYSDDPIDMSYSGLASKLTTAQGDALQNAPYWSSTPIDVFVWDLGFDGSSTAYFSNSPKDDEYRVRAVLAF